MTASANPANPAEIAEAPRVSATDSRHQGSGSKARPNPIGANPDLPALASPKPPSSASPAATVASTGHGMTDRSRPGPASAQPASERRLNILILENVPIDAELMKQALRKGGMDFVVKRVDSRAAFTEALDSFAPDVLLVACAQPDFDGRDALDYVRRTHPQVPVVIIADAISVEGAVELLKAGARDCVLKNNLRRLPSAVIRAVAIEAGIRARKAAEAERARLARMGQNAGAAR